MNCANRDRMSPFVSDPGGEQDDGQEYDRGDGSACFHVLSSHVETAVQTAIQFVRAAQSSSFRTLRLFSRESAGTFLSARTLSKKSVSNSVACSRDAAGHTV